jgi:multiple sugar transport system substrate-binding protein
MDDTTHSPAGISRRDFLATGTAGLAGATLLGASAPYVHTRPQSVEILFAFGPDDSGTLQPLIDDFNREHEGAIRVTWRTVARASDAYYRQIVSDFEADAADMDVFGADVVWTAPLVERGWIRNLSGRFYDAYDTDQFVEAALQSAAYRLRIWGVPWYTDAGVLFYRRDLLEQSGFTASPTTWDELASMAQQITSDTDVEHGFVFQGDEYEGGVANALEYIWNAGGRVMTLNVSVAGAVGQNVTDPNVITVNSADAARGLDTARRLVEDGIAPDTVAQFREEEAWEAFLGGRSVFMRNWPYVYGLLGSEETALTADQIEVAPLPSSSADQTSYSCLGGWNLVINDRSPRTKRDAAWTFIQYLTDPAQQKRRALGGGFLPTRLSVYDDPEVQQQAPGVRLGRDAVARARLRPVSPLYPQMAPRIARAFTRTLQGEFDGREAVQRLQNELQTLVRNR